MAIRTFERPARWATEISGLTVAQAIAYLQTLEPTDTLIAWPDLDTDQVETATQYPVVLTPEQLLALEAEIRQNELAYFPGWLLRATSPADKERLTNIVADLKKKLLTLPKVETPMLKHAISSYLETAIWADAEEGEEGELSPEIRKHAETEVTEFYELVKHLLPNETPELMTRLGHDLWLTRQHHGAGFWDGAWPEIGDQLTQIVHANFREVSLVLGDDGLWYVE